jgi:hypothetical protein
MIVVGVKNAKMKVAVMKRRTRNVAGLRAAGGTMSVILKDRLPG